MCVYEKKHFRDEHCNKILLLRRVLLMFVTYFLYFIILIIFLVLF